MVHEVHNGMVCPIHLLKSHQLLSLLSEVDILVQGLLDDMAEPTQLLIAAVQLFPQLTEQVLEGDTTLTNRDTARLQSTPHPWPPTPHYMPHPPTPWQVKAVDNVTVKKLLYNSFVTCAKPEKPNKNEGG